MKTYYVYTKSDWYFEIKANDKKEAEKRGDFLCRHSDEEFSHVAPIAGGLRQGAGRPKKPPTVTLAFRVPKDKAEDLKAKIKALIKAT